MLNFEGTRSQSYSVDRLTAPIRKYGVGSNPKKPMLKISDNIIDMDVANPFKILSAYFIAAATNSPPQAYCSLNSENTIQQEYFQCNSNGVT